MEQSDLISSLLRNKANLENVKPYEDIQPTEDLLAKAVAELEKNKHMEDYDDKDEW